MNKRAFYITLIIIIGSSLFCFSKALASNSQPRGWLGLVISEIFPNPTDKDRDKEWIKIYNSANTEINLKDWIISDNYGHISPYSFPDDLWLEDDEYIIIERKDTKIILNNFLETVSLFSAQGKLADQVSYIQAPENEIYSYQNGNWQWRKNINDSTKIKKDVKEINRKNLDWNSFSSLKNEEEILLSGIVISLPKQIASQYFLLSEDKLQSNIIQIYNYQKDFPNLKIGETIEVSGRFSSSSSYYRLKTNKANDIKNTDIAEIDLTPLEIENNLKSENIGKLFTILAEIKKIKKYSLNVINIKEGADNKELEVNTELISDKFSKNQILEAKGILLKNSKDFVLKIIPEYGYNIYSNSSSSSSTGSLGSKTIINNNFFNNKFKIVLMIFILSILLIYLGRRKKISFFDL